MARRHPFYDFVSPAPEPVPEGMSRSPVSGERNWDRDATGGITTRSRIEPAESEKSLPLELGLSSRRRCTW